MKASNGATSYSGYGLVYLFRAMIVLSFVLLIYHRELAQEVVNVCWKYLLGTWLFNCVYFETFFATFCHSIIACIYPKFIHACRTLDDYKISNSIQFVEYDRSFIRDAVVYMAPLMFLDTFMVKKYYGVDPSIWEEKRISLIQTTRALPLEPPTVLQICCHLMASLVVFDALFFIVHVTLHKNYFLYKHIHAQHHDHHVLNAHVTNKLSIPERVALVLSANEALKVFNSHPMTRMLFVPIFIAILIDNHTGYDMPFSLHRLVPFGLVGGSVNHYAHHMQGTRNYEPILTYLDRLLDIFMTFLKRIECASIKKD